MQKDTFNYLAEGTQEGLTTLARAVGEGLFSGLNPGRAAGTLARVAVRPMIPTPRFSKHCGRVLTTS